jgi:hypothetical protein
MAFHTILIFSATEYVKRRSFFVEKVASLCCRIFISFCFIDQCVMFVCKMFECLHQEWLCTLGFGRETRTCYYWSQHTDGTKQRRSFPSSQPPSLVVYIRVPYNLRYFRFSKQSGFFYCSRRLRDSVTLERPGRQSTDVAFRVCHTPPPPNHILASKIFC